MNRLDWLTEEADADPRVEGLCREGLDEYAALAFARRWREGRAWDTLEPWQRFGPELLETVVLQNGRYRVPILCETSKYLYGIAPKARAPMRWLASTDALDKLMYRHCTDYRISAAAAGGGEKRFLNLRAEAFGYLLVAFIIAGREFVRALR
jgi:hypothetical protein